MQCCSLSDFVKLLQREKLKHSAEQFYLYESIYILEKGDYATN